MVFSVVGWDACKLILAGEVYMFGHCCFPVLLESNQGPAESYSTYPGFVSVVWASSTSVGGVACGFGMGLPEEVAYIKCVPFV